MIHSLVRHQAWADAAVLQAARTHAGAKNDERIRWILHHMVLVQQAFLSVFLERPLDMQKFQKEMQKIPEFHDIERRFQASHAEELAFVSALTEAELGRPIDVPWIPNLRLTLEEGLMQVVMHSQGHRAQCLSRLREIGGTPPTLDFILWIKDRPGPVWG